MLQEILKKILEGFDVVAFFAALFYALVGITCVLLYQANKRDVNKPGSPVEFSKWHLIKDNAIRISTSIVFIMVFLRFSTNMLGATITSWLGFVLGLVSDSLGGWIQRIAGGFRCQVNDFIDRVFPPKSKE